MPPLRTTRPCQELLVRSPPAAAGRQRARAEASRRSMQGRLRLHCHCCSCGAALAVARLPLPHSVWRCPSSGNAQQRWRRRCASSKARLLLAPLQGKALATIDCTPVEGQACCGPLGAETELVRWLAVGPGHRPAGLLAAGLLAAGLAASQWCCRAVPVLQYGGLVRSASCWEFLWVLRRGQPAAQ